MNSVLSETNLAQFNLLANLRGTEHSILKREKKQGLKEQLKMNRVLPKIRSTQGPLAKAATSDTISSNLSTPAESKNASVDKNWLKSAYKDAVTSK